MIAKENNTLLVIETGFGGIEILLYDNTPRHRDNFIQLVNDGFYENQIFHRVIKDFMIQGGDIANRKEVFGNDGVNTYDYTLPAEIIYPEYFHKRGALAAARLGDNINPGKESSPTQFYIVTGTVFTDPELDLMEKRRFERLKQEIFNRLNSDNKDIIKGFYRSGEKGKLSEFRNSLISEAAQRAEEQKQKVMFTKYQREIYRTVGGAPHLDGDYTVFGEVISGLDVVNEIQQVPVHREDRPVTNVKFNLFFKKRE